MAAKSTLVNMVVCLTAVCTVCAAILAGVNAVTADPIAEAAQKALTESISAVLPEGGELSDVQSIETPAGVFEYYTLSTEGQPVAYAVKSMTNGFGGTLAVMVGILPDGTVYNTSVLSHSETPGLGAKCTDADSHFRKQFEGFNGNLAVTKDGGDVDAITASTITSRAFTLAVKNAVEAVAALQVNVPAEVLPEATEEETTNE